jgi:hypothetical protein
MFEKVLDIGLKVYQMPIEELSGRKTELLKLYEVDKENQDIRIEILVINTRMIDEGLVDIDKLDIDDRDIIKMYIGFK